MPSLPLNASEDFVVAVRADRHVILSVSSDPLLQRVRGLVLEKCGYKVVFAAVHEQALEVIRKSAVDLVILGHVLAWEERLRLAAEIKALRPGLPVIGLHAITEFWPPDSQVDIWVEALSGPANLMAAVARLLPPPRSKAAAAD